KRIYPLETLDNLPNDDFDVIVNCSGYGARDLVQDHEVECHRGQVVIVPNEDSLAEDRPWAMVCPDDDSLTYVIPRKDGLVLGGVNADGCSRNIDPAATETILERCLAEGVRVKRPIVKPPLVGIRPYRKRGVCVELAKRLVKGR